jgi:hypothetical protein
VELIEGRSPYYSRDDRTFLVDKYDSGELFPYLPNPARAHALTHLLDFHDHLLIPSLKTFLEDTKWLETSSKVLKQLVPQSKGTLRRSFWNYFSPPVEGAVSMQKPDGNFEERASNSEDAFWLCYAQLHCFAQREFPSMCELRPRKDKRISSAVSLTRNSVQCWAELAATAIRIGFDTPCIRHLLSGSIAATVARNMLSDARPSYLFDFPNMRLEEETTKLAVTLDHVLPLHVTSDSPELTCDGYQAWDFRRRCGRTFERAFRNDQQFTFVRFISQNSLKPTKRRSVTSFGVTHHIFSLFFSDRCLVLEEDSDDDEEPWGSPESPLVARFPASWVNDTPQGSSYPPATSGEAPNSTFLTPPSSYTTGTRDTTSQEEVARKLVEVLAAEEAVKDHRLELKDEKLRLEEMRQLQEKVMVRQLKQEEEDKEEFQKRKQERASEEEEDRKAFQVRVEERRIKEGEEERESQERKVKREIKEEEEVKEQSIRDEEKKVKKEEDKENDKIKHEHEEEDKGEFQKRKQERESEEEEDRKAFQVRVEERRIKEGEEERESQERKVKREIKEEEEVKEQSIRDKEKKVKKEEDKENDKIKHEHEEEEDTKEQQYQDKRTKINQARQEEERKDNREERQHQNERVKKSQAREDEKGKDKRVERLYQEDRVRRTQAREEEERKDKRVERLYQEDRVRRTQAREKEERKDKSIERQYQDDRARRNQAREREEIKQKEGQDQEERSLKIKLKEKKEEDDKEEQYQKEKSRKIKLRKEKDNEEDEKQEEYQARKSLNIKLKKDNDDQEEKQYQIEKSLKIKLRKEEDNEEEEQYQTEKSANAKLRKENDDEEDEKQEEYQVKKSLKIKLRKEEDDEEEEQYQTEKSANAKLRKENDDEEDEKQEEYQVKKSLKIKLRKEKDDEEEEQYQKEKSVNAKLRKDKDNKEDKKRRQYQKEKEEAREQEEKQLKIEEEERIEARLRAEKEAAEDTHQHWPIELGKIKDDGEEMMKTELAVTIKEDEDSHNIKRDSDVHKHRTILKKKKTKKDPKSDKHRTIFAGVPSVHPVVSKTVQFKDERHQNPAATKREPKPDISFAKDQPLKDEDSDFKRVEREAQLFEYEGDTKEESEPSPPPTFTFSRDKIPEQIRSLSSEQRDPDSTMLRKRKNYPEMSMIDSENEDILRFSFKSASLRMPDARFKQGPGIFQCLVQFTESTLTYTLIADSLTNEENLLQAIKEHFRMTNAWVAVYDKPDNLIRIIPARSQAICVAGQTLVLGRGRFISDAVEKTASDLFRRQITEDYIDRSNSVGLDDRLPEISWEAGKGFTTIPGRHAGDTSKRRMLSKRLFSEESGVERKEEPKSDEMQCEDS